MHTATHATTRTQRHMSSCRLAGAHSSPHATLQCTFPYSVLAFLHHVPFHYHFHYHYHPVPSLLSNPRRPTTLSWRARSAATFCGSRVRADPWPSSRFLAAACFHEPWAFTRFLFLSTHYHAPRLPPHWGSVAQQCWLCHRDTWLFLAAVAAASASYADYWP